MTTAYLWTAWEVQSTCNSWTLRLSRSWTLLNVNYRLKATEGVRLPAKWAVRLRLTFSKRPKTRSGVPIPAKQALCKMSPILAIRALSSPSVITWSCCHLPQQAKAIQAFKILKWAFHTYNNRVQNKKIARVGKMKTQEAEASRSYRVLHQWWKSWLETRKLGSSFCHLGKILKTDSWMKGKIVSTT